MTERGEKVLEAVVREFVNFGEPVSSGYLYEKYDFGIRPAMIRAELVALTEGGYLLQPHHSAGRIPTDIGFEFFGELALHREYNRTNDTQEFMELLTDHAWDDFLFTFSKYLGIASVVGEREHSVHKRGMEYIVKDLLLYAPGAIAEAVRDIECIDSKFTNLEKVFPEEDILRVFIGRKSPVTKSKELSVIISDYNVDGERVFVVAVGPKRMNYEKTARAMRGLKNTNN
jgi:transcriptional regulator of heat shock response